MSESGVRYVVRDGYALAYEVFGSGPVDLIVLQSLYPIDLMWELPQLASFLESLGRMARVIAYDHLGVGASDPLPMDEAAQVETQSDDLLAVLDAAGSERVTILDMVFGTGSVLFAATYPERVRSLILVHQRSSFPELRGLSTEHRQAIARGLTTTENLELENPRVAHDPTIRRWWGRARRLSANPWSTAQLMGLAARVDVESVLPAVRTPTLVLHRRDTKLHDLDASRRTAALMPDARFVELPGSESALYLGDSEPALAEIEHFLAEGGTVPDDTRQLATVLFTDIVSSTERLARVGDTAWRQEIDAHDRIVSGLCREYRGSLIKSLGDGMLATFDGPGRAVRCAQAIREALVERGLDVRAGLHTGEIERRGDDVVGIAVHIAARISALAGGGEILTSRTLVDLTAGSGLEFAEWGTKELKGVPGEWAIFASTEA